MATITSANCVFMLSISGVFNTPQQLQGFAADDIFTTPAVTPVETLMGVDGVLSGGWTPVPVPQTISLQADSSSSIIFDSWAEAQISAGDVYVANGSVRLNSISSLYTMVNGFLTSYMPIPDARKILQPRRFTITWQKVIPTPI